MEILGEDYRGYISSIRTNERFSHTKVLRYYKTKETKKQLFDYFNKLYDNLESLRSQINEKG